MKKKMLHGKWLIFATWSFLEK